MTVTAKDLKAYADGMRCQIDRCKVDIEVARSKSAFNVDGASQGEAHHENMKIFWLAEARGVSAAVEFFSALANARAESIQ